MVSALSSNDVEHDLTTRDAGFVDRGRSAAEARFGVIDRRRRKVHEKRVLQLK